MRLKTDGCKIQWPGLRWDEREVSSGGVLCGIKGQAFLQDKHTLFVQGGDFESGSALLCPHLPTSLDNRILNRQDRRGTGSSSPEGRGAR